MIKKALVVLSGGQDSTVCAYWAKEHFDEIHGVTFNYGQRHEREVEAAMRIAELVNLKSHWIVTLGPVLGGTSPLTNMDEKLEQYPDFEQMDKTIGDRVELTFVPMRNQLFLTIAANRAVCLGINNIVTGVCQADNANYPDCRENFINSLVCTINYSLGLMEPGKPHLLIDTPLMNNSKADTVKLALKYPGCWEALAYSHTAYDGSYPPTGKDHATVLRAHGFEEAGYPDPLIVRAWHEELIKDLPKTKNYEHLRKTFEDKKSKGTFRDVLLESRVQS